MDSVQLDEGALLNGRYRIVRVLGQGGMGTVYLAEHIQLDMVLAVKEVRGLQSGGPDYRAELEQCGHEARVLVRLNHPNLPKVNDAFIEADRFYLAMEYIEGSTLEARLRDAQGEPLAVAEVMEWALQIADVLAYLHSQDPPIIFRDIKPSNVMVESTGHIRLIDFGIARRFNVAAERDTSLLGSVGYSPPEQFGRGQTDSRSDIYALGATLHHLLTGQDPAAHPFKFPPASINPAVPEALSNLLARCLSIDADRRPASVHEVAQALIVIRDAMRAMPAIPPVQNAAPQAAAPPPAPAGPKITSAKLAAAERKLRPSGSSSTSSGRTDLSMAPVPAAGPVAARSKALITAGVAGVVLLAFAVAMALSHSRHGTQSPEALKGRHNAPSATIASTTQTEPIPGASPRGSSSPPIQSAPSVGPTAANPSVPPAADRSVTFSSTQVAGLSRDSQGNAMLRIVANGSIQGQQSAAGTIAVFLYTADGKALSAVDPHSVYANQEGQLSVAQSVKVASDDQPFQVTLDVPLSQFPQAALAIPVSYRCLAFMNASPAGESDLTPVPFLIAAALQSQPSGAQPSGPGQSANGTLQH